MSELLIKNCTKATFFNDGYNAVNFLQNADILIKDNYIVRIDKNIERDCAVIDGTNLLAIPGLIDGASSCLTSKISHVLCEDIDFGRFGDTPIYARINPLINIALKNLDSCQLKSILELAIYEAAQSGTTTLIERCSPKELRLPDRCHRVQPQPVGRRAAVPAGHHCNLQHRPPERHCAGVSAVPVGCAVGRSA